jgi:cytochrome c-type biogenesis protein CcmH
MLTYVFVGSPGAPDQPFAARLAAWKDHPEKFSPLELAAALRSISASRPEDIEPLRRLAAIDLAIGDLDGASHALRKSIALQPDNADLLAALGEVMVIKAQGAVGAEARGLFEHALRVDPRELTARYYLARGEIASGDIAGGLAGWRGLLATLPPNDPRRAQLVQSIDVVTRTGRLDEDSDAAAQPAGEMTGAISGMVEGLAQRLRAHPDDPDGWVRLVRAYTVLGDGAKRDAALAEARRRFAGRRDVMSALDDALKAPPMASGGQ